MQRAIISALASAILIAFLASFSSCASNPPSADATAPTGATTQPADKPAASSNPAEPTAKLLGLRQLAQARGLELGAALDFKAMSNAKYASVMGSEFNVLTSENQMKWEYMQATAGQFERFFTDTILEFASARAMRVRGHTLVWHSQLPNWVRETAKTRDDILDIVRKHVEGVVGYYKGRIYKWDVVNEVIDDNAEMRPSVFYVLSGTDFIDTAFKAAHQADPAALLYINDYSVEGINPKSDRLYELCKGLVARGVPIHGVGFQSHWELDGMPTMESVRANIARFVALGLKVDITELDIRFSGPATEQRLKDQAAAYRKVIDLILSTDGTDTLVLWGVDDGHSWVPRWNSSFGSALILDRKYQPKPAYFAIAEALKK